MTIIEVPTGGGPWALRRSRLAAAAAAATSSTSSDASAEQGTTVSTSRLASLPVLAPLLPLLLLFGVCIAGMSDPPAPQPGHPGQVVSRLHIDVQPMPRFDERDVPGHRAQPARR